MTAEVINHVKYYQYGDYYIVGNNSTSNGNGIDDLKFSGEIIIEPKVNGKDVIEVGKYAFRECYYITKIIIYAKIKAINEKSFSHCIKLQYINVPASVTFIGLHGLFFGSGDGNMISIPITVEFNAGRKESLFLGSENLNYRKNLSILYPSNLALLCNANGLFTSTKYVSFCSFSNNPFLSKHTSDPSLCPAPLFKSNDMLNYASCRHYSRKSKMILICFYIALSVT